MLYINGLPFAGMHIMREMSQKYPSKTYGALSIGEVMTRRRIERFRSKVDDTDGPGLCHPWRGSRNQGGYGMFQGSVAYAGYSFLAHRVAFWLAHQREPIGMVLHSCDNPCCCNPAHLREGTAADNMQDMISRGRQFVAKGPRGPQKPELAREAYRLRYVERLPLADVAARLGVHRATVGRWMQ